MRQVKFQSYIGLRVPAEIPDLVNAAAEKVMQKPTAYIRQALSERLQRDGISFDPTQKKSSRSNEPTFLDR